jgi:hypothetical protein
VAGEYRKDLSTLNFDAYYDDEFGDINDPCNTPDANAPQLRAGHRKSRFTDVTNGPNPCAEDTKRKKAAAETARHITQRLDNPANPHRNSALKDKSNQTAPKDHSDKGLPYKFYFSDDVMLHWNAVKKGRPWGRPINLTIYHGVGFELNRHGIRSRFEKLTNMQAIVQVPGNESVKFGISIATDQIRLTLNTFFGRDVPFKVKILAAFSTGYSGLNQTILNELVSLSEVERVVFFDCLYEFGSGSTVEALRLLKRRRPGAKIIVYQTSESGNSYTDGTRTVLSVSRKAPSLFDSNLIISNLYQRREYISLICFRCIHSAVQDSMLARLPAWGSAYEEMKKAVAHVARGNMISNKLAYQLIYGSIPKGKTVFADWYASNKKAVDDFSKLLGRVSDPNSIRGVLWGERLPGWA